jgi:hypothetical protein
MLDQEMSGADLAIVRRAAIRSAGIGSDLRRAMMLGHVCLELLRVGSWRGLPSRRLLRLVKVVGEVLGIGVSNLPAGGQSCVCLLYIWSWLAKLLFC